MSITVQELLREAIERLDKIDSIQELEELKYGAGEYLKAYQRAQSRIYDAAFAKLKVGDRIQLSVSMPGLLDGALGTIRELKTIRNRNYIYITWDERDLHYHEHDSLEFVPNEEIFDISHLML